MWTAGADAVGGSGAGSWPEGGAATPTRAASMAETGLFFPQLGSRAGPSAHTSSLSVVGPVGPGWSLDELFVTWILTCITLRTPHRHRWVSPQPPYPTAANFLGVTSQKLSTETRENLGLTSLPPSLFSPPCDPELLQSPC